MFSHGAQMILSPIWQVIFPGFKEDYAPELRSWVVDVESIIMTSWMVLVVIC